MVSSQPFGKAVVGTAGVVIISILVSMSAFGAANGTLLSSSRILFVASREGNCPKFMSGLHNSARTPVPAIVFEVNILLFLFCFGIFTLNLMAMLYQCLCLKVITTTYYYYYYYYYYLYMLY